MRTVGRGVTLGLGVRVLRGDATGYAYTEELSDDRMLEAARTAAQIASSGAAPGPDCVQPVPLPDFYPVPRPSLERARATRRSRCCAGPTRRRAAPTRASCASRSRWPRSGARCWSSAPTGTWRAIASR